MPIDPHEQARRLVDREPVEGIGADEQSWLALHLAACAACAAYAETAARTVRALGAFAFEVDPLAACRVERVVRARADGMAPAPERLWTGGIPLALALTVMGSLAMWQSALWLAGRWHLPEHTWHTAFALLWLLPSLLLDVLLLFPARFLGPRAGGGETL